MRAYTNLVESRNRATVTLQYLDALSAAVAPLLEAREAAQACVTDVILRLQGAEEELIACDADLASLQDTGVDLSVLGVELPDPYVPYSGSAPGEAQDLRSQITSLEGEKFSLRAQVIAKDMEISRLQARISQVAKAETESISSSVEPPDQTVPAKPNVFQRVVRWGNTGKTK